MELNHEAAGRGRSPALGDAFPCSHTTRSIVRGTIILQFCCILLGIDWPFW